MSKPTCTVLFAGGGGVEVGFLSAGIDCVQRVEFDEQIAAVNELNFGPGVICKPVQCVDVQKLAKTDYLWASPPCQSHSVARSKKLSERDDADVGIHILDYVRWMRPKAVCIENVPPYAGAPVFSAILAGLLREDYQFEWGIVNAADYGGWNKCPIHASFAGQNSHLETAPDIVAASAMTPPDVQAKHLAWDALAHLVKATNQAIAADAPCLAMENEGRLALLTLFGKAGSILTGADTSKLGSMGDICESIEWLLKELLGVPSLLQRWFTMSTATQQITALKIFGCTNATQSTQDHTMQSGQSLPGGSLATSGDCPLCHYSGIPQTRKRLILRAVRKGETLTPLVPTHAKEPEPAGLFGPGLLPWVGWYAAIEDILHTLPESKFADWQIKRLPKELFGDTLFSNHASEDAEGNRVLTVMAGVPPAMTVAANERSCRNYRALLMRGDNAGQEWGKGYRDAEEPSASLTGSADPKALLIEGDAAGDRPPTCRTSAEPAFTLKTPGGGRVHRAFIVDGQETLLGYDGKRLASVPHGGQPVQTVTATAYKGMARAWLEQGRVVAMTPRALAAFQSFPDTYILPQSKSLASKVIGNAVCPTLAAAIGRTLPR